MWEILSSADFWFGAAVLGAYQIAKFREISVSDPDIVARQSLIPNLQARDFAGRPAFFLALGSFLAVVFATYFVLCNVSPVILEGWAKVSGASEGVELDAFVDSVHYPLYIAAAFIGFTQPGIPLLSNIGNVQRNLFHAFIGVPRRVMTTSTFFANQILARCIDNKELAKELHLLVSDAWLERIDEYADTDFYRAQLARLKLDDEAEIKEALKGSQRELKNLTRQLVDIAALACVREGGMGSLSRLADDLHVATEDDPDLAKAFLSGAILFLIGMTFLWNVIPLFDGLAMRFLSAGPEFDLWPNDLKFSGQYLVSQAAPIFLASGAAIAVWLGAFRRSRTSNVSGHRSPSSLAEHFNRYAGLFASIVIGIVVFDLFQAFFEIGFYKSGSASGFWAFIPANLPFYLLHSFISLVVCFVVLLYMDDGLAQLRGRAAPMLGFLTLGVGLISVLYVATRIEFAFGKEFGANGLDMAVLIAAINISAAMLAFASAALCKRQAETSRRNRQSVLAGPAGAAATTVATPQTGVVGLVSPSAAGS